MPRKPKPAPLSKFGAWADHLGLSSAEIGRRLEMSQTLVRRLKVRGGDIPTLRNALKIVIGTDGEITFEDLVPSSVLRETRRYRGRLLQ